jgi:hypothetical protein
MLQMELVTIYYYVESLGDGSVCLRWFRNKKNAIKADRNQEEGWGESSVGSITTVSSCEEWINAEDAG